MSKNRYEDNFWADNREHFEKDGFSPNPLRKDSIKSDYSFRNARQDNLRSFASRKRSMPKRSSTPFKPREIPKPLAVRQKEKREKQQKRVLLRNQIKDKLRIKEDSLLLFESFSDKSLEKKTNKKRPALSRSLKTIMETEMEASSSVNSKQLSSLFTSTILNKNKTE